MPIKSKTVRRTSAFPKKSPVSAMAKAPPAKTSKAKRWSAAVMQRSVAMNLRAGVFTLKSAKNVARSLKKSSQASRRRESTPFRSAMPMLNCESNRGGKNLSVARRKVLNKAKQELRRLFGRRPPS